MICTLFVIYRRSQIGPTPSRCVRRTCKEIHLKQQSTISHYIESRYKFAHRQEIYGNLRVVLLATDSEIDNIWGTVIWSCSRLTSISSLLKAVTIFAIRVWAMSMLDLNNYIWMVTLLHRNANMGCTTYMLCPSVAWSGHVVAFFYFISSDTIILILMKIFFFFSATSSY